MITNADYQLTLNVLNTLGKPYSNVFYYKRVSGTSTAGDLNDAFEDKIYPFIQDVVHVSMDFTTIDTINLADENDFGSNGLGGFGSRGGERCNSSLVWAFELVRSTRLNRRNGRKAFGDLSENDVLDGQLNNGLGETIMTPIANLAAALTSQIFVGGGTGLYQLCLPRSTKGSGLGEDPLKYYLRELHPVNFVRYKRVSTQNSHKNF